jgi:uncharacterized membrane protein YiaA
VLLYSVLLSILLFDLFSVISVYKTVRDKLEDIQVTDMYYDISWFTSFVSVVLLVFGVMLTVVNK